MIKSLTALRGVFILFIFFHHCRDLFLGGGDLSVAFFFVLGGFCMTLGYKEKVFKPDFNFKQYFKLRCIKFYPLHWLCLLLIIPWALQIYHWKYISVFFINALLLQSWVPISSVYFSFNSASWYLADTLFFSLMFPLLIKQIGRGGAKPKIIIISCLVIFYTCMAFMIPSEYRDAVLYISPLVRLTDFVFGIFLGLGYFELKKKNLSIFYNASICQILSLLLVFGLFIESCLLPKNVMLIAPVFWVPIALLILISSFSSSNGGGILWNNRPLQFLGEISFTFYLVHILVLRYVTMLFDIIKYDNIFVYIGITLALTILASALLDNYFVKPVTRWLKNIVATKLK